MPPCSSDSDFFFQVSDSHTHTHLIFFLISLCMPLIEVGLISVKLLISPISRHAAKRLDLTGEAWAGSETTDLQAKLWIGSVPKKKPWCSSLGGELLAARRYRETDRRCPHRSARLRERERHEVVRDVSLKRFQTFSLALHTPKNEDAIWNRKWFFRVPSKNHFWFHEEPLKPEFFTELFPEIFIQRTYKGVSKNLQNTVL